MEWLGNRKQLLDIFRYCIFFLKINLLSVSSNVDEHHLSQISFSIWTLLSQLRLKTERPAPLSHTVSWARSLRSCAFILQYDDLLLESVCLCYHINSMLFVFSPEPKTTNAWNIGSIHPYVAGMNHFLKCHIQLSHDSQIPLPNSFWRNSCCSRRSYWNSWGEIGSKEGNWQLPIVKKCCLCIHWAVQDMRHSAHS